MKLFSFYDQDGHLIDAACGNDAQEALAEAIKNVGMPCNRPFQAPLELEARLKRWLTVRTYTEDGKLDEEFVIRYKGE